MCIIVYRIVIKGTFTKTREDGERRLFYFHGRFTFKTRVKIDILSTEKNMTVIVCDIATERLV